MHLTTADEADHPGAGRTGLCEALPASHMLAPGRSNRMKIPCDGSRSCQGGGCHTAFTTGALAAIIREQLVHDDFEIVALSGTSGGAIAALLAWYGILVDGGKAALEPLDRFWREGFPRGGAARLLADRIANAAYVSALRLPVSAAVSHLYHRPPAQRPARSGALTAAAVAGCPRRPSLSAGAVR